MNHPRLPENVTYSRSKDLYVVHSPTGETYEYKTEKGAINRAKKEAGEVVEQAVRTPLNQFIEDEAKRQRRKVRDLAVQLSLSERQVYKRLSGEIDWRVMELHTLARFFNMGIAKFVDLALRTRRLHLIKDGDHASK